MCGLVAQMIPNDNGFFPVHMEHFGHAMFLNQLRGSDSTGVVGIAKDGDNWWCKEVGGWDTLRYSKGYTEWEKSSIASGKLIYGHGRSATRGTVTLANAHPFSLDKKSGKDNKIILVHNGTLSGFQTLKGMEKFDVDSEWLGAMIAEHGSEKALSEINGAVATMWYDTEEQTFNIFRNDDRPLYYFKTKMGAWYINSEAGSLFFLKVKHGLDWLEGPKLFESFKLHTFQLKDINSFTSKAVPIYVAPMRPIRPPIDYTQGRRRQIGVSGSDGALTIGSQVFLERLNSKNLLSDMHQVANGAIHCIKWSAKGRTTTYAAGGELTDTMGPYEDHLIEICAGDLSKQIVLKKYRNNGTSWTMPYYRDNGFFAPWSGVEQKLDDSESESPENRCITLKYKAGKEIKFSSPGHHGTEQISHKALVHPQHRFHFVSYENNIDGRVKCGERIKVEITDVKKTANPKFLRVLGYRLQERQDTVMDVTFFTDKWTEDEIAKIGYFEGTITYIQILTKEQHEDTGGYIDVRLHDIQPLTMVLKDAAKTEAEQNTH